MRETQGPFQVTIQDISEAMRRLRAPDGPICIHSSLGSFGSVEGGARAIIDGILAEGCTLLVPTFSYAFQMPPPPHRRPVRNGSDYEWWDRQPLQTVPCYALDSLEVDADMGVIPETVLRTPGRIRGEHPLCSFTAIGPLAHRLISGQEPLDVNAPLKALAEADGLVILMGVGLESMTLIHAAEELAGRNLFRRWASGPDNMTVEVETGGCSEGFENLRSALSPLMAEIKVGQSTWLAFPAKRTLETAARAVREDPWITHCNNAACERCNDAVLGGPIL